jgi:hypothetical protein
LNHACITALLKGFDDVGNRHKRFYVRCQEKIY